MHAKRQGTLYSWQFWAYAVLFVGFAAGSVSLLSTPIDDAFISFRYLDNWLRGQGLVFNPGERVEGYSNFLWIAILAIPSLFGAAPYLASPEIEWFLALGCLGLLAVGARKAADLPNGMHLFAPVLLALNSAFFFWIGKGMEVVFYTTLQIALAVVILVCRTHRVEDHSAASPKTGWKPVLRGTLSLRDALLMGLIAAAAALTRPEGAVAPAIVLGALAVADRDRRKNYLLALVILAAAVAGQFIFRLLYYGPLWPNTYYAKRLPTNLAIAAGLRYLRKFLVGSSEQAAWFYASGWASHLPIWVVCAAAWVFAAKQWRKLWPATLQMVSLVAVAIYVGGDWMPAFRFFVPAIPLGCLLVAAGLSEMAHASEVRGERQEVGEEREAASLLRWRRLLAHGLLVILVMVEGVALVDMIRSHEFGRWRHHIHNYGPMAAWLKGNAREGSLVALSDIGIISYYNPKLRFIDVLGLTDPHIAALSGIHHLKTDVDYVLRSEPDYVLVMFFEWPEIKKTLPKTAFDAMFLKHVAEKNDYEGVAEVFGWKEGLWGERHVWFDVYARKTTTGQSELFGVQALACWLRSKIQPES